MSFHDKHLTENDAARKGVRKIDRDSLFMTGRLHVVGSDQAIDVRIRNLSAGGMMAEPNFSVVNGQRVRIELRNIGMVEGRIAWANDRQFGIAFDDPIDPKVVRRPIGASETVKPVTLRKVAKYGRPGIVMR